MSAWDIVGVVIWTPLAIFNNWAVVATFLQPGPPPDSLGTGIMISVMLTAATVFCIARLCGATA